VLAFSTEMTNFIEESESEENSSTILKMTFKERVYVLVNEDTKLGNLFGTFIILLIVLNMVAIILESIKTLEANYKWLFDGFEHFCLAFFTIEYVARMYTADIKSGQKGWRPYIKYFFSFMALVDLFAILPSLLILILPQGMLANLQFIRMLRIMRIFRVLKITRYSSSLKMMGEVLKDKASDLSITIFITFVLMILASTLMYYAEHSAQPDQFPDIVHAFWWAVATLTTVGYGDVYPVTALGKILSGIIAILGIGLVALPTGILSSAFVDKMEGEKARKRGERDGDEEEEMDGEEETEMVAEVTSVPAHESNGIAEEQAAQDISEQESENGQGETVDLTGAPVKFTRGKPGILILPDGKPIPCPHDSLRANGQFPSWMKFCPLCGEEMAPLPVEKA